MTRRIPALGIAVLIACVSGPLQAQEDAPSWEAARAEPAAAAGAFSPSAQSPSTQTHRLLAYTTTTYDGARGAGLVDVRGDAVLLRGEGRRRAPLGLAAYAGGAYVGPSSIDGAATTVRGGLRLQPLFQQRAGVDGALAAGYSSRGFNLQPCVDITALLARRFGSTQVLMNLTYGQGLREQERYGAARLATLTPLFGALRAGAELFALGDLELDQDEPEAEPELELAAGPTLSYAAGPLALTASGGFTLLRYRLVPELFLGARATFGVGVAL